MEKTYSPKIIYRKKHKKLKVGMIIASIIVLLGAFTMLFPYIYMVFTSFKSSAEAFGEPLTLAPAKWLIDAYVDIVSDDSFYMSILYTLVVEISVILVGTFFSTVAAFAFAKLKLPFKKSLLLIMMSSMMVPYAAVMLPQYRAFQALNMVETLYPLILPGLFGNISMMFFLITYMKNGIPDSLIESAKIDGSSYPRMVIRLAFPLAKPAIAAQAIFWFVGIWNDYFAPSIYLTGKVKTLQVYLTSLVTSSSGNVDLPKLMAGSVLASIPMIIIFFCFQNFFMNSIAFSGMKE